MSFRWFNLSSPRFRVFGKTMKLWNLFNRHSYDHWWGFGLMQVGGRHLVFIGHTDGGPKFHLGFLKVVGR